MKYTVEEALGHAEVDWAGHFASEAAVESFREVLACSTGGFVLDVRALDLNLPTRALELPARRIAELLENRPLAGSIVAPDSLSFGLMRVFVAFLGAAGEAVHVCRSHSEALEALYSAKSHETCLPAAGQFSATGMLKRSSLAGSGRKSHI